MVRKLLLAALLLAAAPVHAETPQLKTPKEKTSYALGVNLAGNLKQQGVEIDPALVQQGMRDAYAGKTLLMDEEELRKHVSIYQNKVRNNQAATRTAAAQQNKKTGAAFLAHNAKKAGVVTLPSGLQYQILKEGDGKKPGAADTVEFHYRSASIGGREIESSYRTEQPAQRKVAGGVLPGLSEALKLMPVGSKWRLFLPPQLAYGVRGSGEVGPEETVVFDVELLGVK